MTEQYRHYKTKKSDHYSTSFKTTKFFNNDNYRTIKSGVNTNSTHLFDNYIFTRNISEDINLILGILIQTLNEVDIWKFCRITYSTQRYWNIPSNYVSLNITKSLQLKPFIKTTKLLFFQLYHLYSIPSSSSTYYQSTNWKLCGYEIRKLPVYEANIQKTGSRFLLWLDPAENK